MKYCDMPGKGEDPPPIDPDKDKTDPDPVFGQWDPVDA